MPGWFDLLVAVRSLMPARVEKIRWDRIRIVRYDYSPSMEYGGVLNRWENTLDVRWVIHEGEDYQKIKLEHSGERDDIGDEHYYTHTCMEVTESKRFAFGHDPNHTHKS